NLGFWDEVNQHFVINDDTTYIRLFAQVGLIFNGTTKKKGLVHLRIVKNGITTGYPGMPQQRQFVDFGIVNPDKEIFLNVSSLMRVEKGDIIEMQVYAAGESGV